MLYRDPTCKIFNLSNGEDMSCADVINAILVCYKILQFCIAFSDVTCFSTISQQNIDNKLYRLRFTHYSRAFRDTRLSELHVLTNRQK